MVQRLEDSSILEHKIQTSAVLLERRYPDDVHQKDDRKDERK